MNPTPHPDINQLLQELLSNVQAILGAQLVGMYLYGSLSSGDFDRDRSDVDFVVVTEGEVSEESFHELEQMHVRLAEGDSKWAKKLEGAYIPRRSVRGYDPADAPHPFLNEGVFRVENLGSDWIIQRFIIREHGIVVAGPNPKTLIDPVQPGELKTAVRGVLIEWWLPQLLDASRLHSRGYQAYAVVTMCRALYTLRHGTIASKPISVAWAKNMVDEQWRPLIERAAAWRLGDGVNDIVETLAFIRYTLDRVL